MNLNFNKNAHILPLKCITYQDFKPLPKVVIVLIGILWLWLSLNWFIKFLLGKSQFQKLPFGRFCAKTNLTDDDDGDEHIRASDNDDEYIDNPIKIKFLLLAIILVFTSLIQFYYFSAVKARWQKQTSNFEHEHILQMKTSTCFLLLHKFDFIYVPFHESDVWINSNGKVVWWTFPK